MRLTCPACAARYDVPDGAIPPAGRRVRCKSCGEQWTALPEPMLLDVPAPTGAPATPPPAASESVRPRPVPPPRRRRRATVWIAALLALAAGLAIGWLLAGRAGLAPPVQLPLVGQASPTSLTLTANAVNRAVAGGGNVWEVSGVIANNTQTAQRVPPVEVTLLAEGGREYYRWQVPAPATRLEPGGQVAFETATVNTPVGARRVRVALRAAG